MTWQWLMGWWNLIFVAPFAVALLYLLVYTITGVTFGDADVDADADANVDANADADADADADQAHGVGHHTSGHGGGGGAPYYALALSWLGVGKVPLSLMLLVFLLTWGSVGFLTNAAARERGADGWEAARWSIPLALLVGVLVTRTVVMLLARYVPLNATSALPLRGLVGSVGEALYPIDAAFGMAVVRDANGDLKHVACRVGEGVAPVEKGARVRLVAYDDAARMFYVAADEEPASAAAGATTKSGGAL
jgi:hypothetical protein